MRLSTRGRYGVRAMLDLALFDAEGPVNLKQIAQRQDISIDYLEQLLRKLRRAGLVRSVRGPAGGFVLTRPPAEICLWDIVAALEDEIMPVFCVDEVSEEASLKKCARASDCATRRLWLGLARQIQSYLEARTLQEMVTMSKAICNGTLPKNAMMFDI